MQKGDISGDSVPALGVVFEGLIAEFKPEVGKRIFGLRKGVRASRTLDQFVLNEHVVHVLMDVAYRRPLDVDVITYMGEEMAEAVAKRLDREQVPYRSVLSFTPEVLARKIAYMPDLFAIYDPDPSHRFLYGGKGRYTTPADADAIGRF